jgi:DNA-binding FrmR family transcriptional regulator
MFSVVEHRSWLDCVAPPYLFQVTSGIAGDLLGAPHQTADNSLTNVRSTTRTNQEDTRLIKRARRILGQAEAIERRISDRNSCTDILLLIASTRGALNALMTEVIEYHVRTNLVKPQLNESTAQACEELIDVVRSYLK